MGGRSAAAPGAAMTPRGGGGAAFRPPHGGSSRSFPPFLCLREPQIPPLPGGNRWAGRAAAAPLQCSAKSRAPHIRPSSHSASPTSALPPFGILQTQLSRTERSPTSAFPKPDGSATRSSSGHTRPPSRPASLSAAAAVVRIHWGRAARCADRRTDTSLPRRAPPCRGWWWGTATEVGQRWLWPFLPWCGAGRSSKARRERADPPRGKPSSSRHWERLRVKSTERFPGTLLAPSVRFSRGAPRGADPSSAAELRARNGGRGDPLSPAGSPPLSASGCRELPLQPSASGSHRAPPARGAPPARRGGK